MKYTLLTYSLLILLALSGSDIYGQKLVSKPFVGHTDTSSIQVWCMFKKATAVFIRNSDGQQQVFVWNKSTCFRRYLPVSVRFEHLAPHQMYSLSYSFNNKDFYPLIKASTDKDTLQDLRFLAGSCAFIGTGFNRAIKPFNSLQIFRHMKNDSSDMMLWLGDNLYYVLQRMQYKPQLKRNIKTRLNKKLNAFLASRQQYAIWDDHDYGTNNSDGSFRYKQSSLHVFRQFWPNPVHDSCNYYTFTKSDAQFFMLDDRYNNEQEHVVLGNTQLQWLKKALAASTATFKFICIGMQALNPVSTKECFYKTEKEYKELVDFIRQQHISGVLFISGDRHHAELMKVLEDGLYPLYDFTTSPLTMYPVKVSKKSKEFVNPYKIPGTYYPSYNYGKITLSGPCDARKCLLEVKNQQGKIVWTYEIPAAELRFSPDKNK